MRKYGRFCFKQGIPVSYPDQGYIYFWSKRYHYMTKAERETVERACEEAGGEYAAAVLEFVTTDRGVTAVSMKHHLSEETLQRKVRNYYIIMAKKI